MKMGIRAFIFSGYPHLDECRHFGTKVLPQLKTCSLPRLRPGTAFTPPTPLGTGEAHLMDRLERGEAAAGVAAPMERVELAPGLSLSRIVYGMWRLCDDEDTSPAHVQAKDRKLPGAGDHLARPGRHLAAIAPGVLGRCLKAAPHLRDKVEIVTKCDIVAPAGRYAHAQVKHYDTSAAHIARSIDLSLQRNGRRADRPAPDPSPRS